MENQYSPLNMKYSCLDRQQGAEVGGVLVEGGGQEAGGEVRGGGQVKGGDSVPGVTAGTTIFYI